MNFKKIVSAVSALAISVSAFAGLAVTANAFATVTNDYESGVLDWTSGNTGRYTASIVEDGDNHYMSVAAVATGNNGTTVSTNSSYQATVDANTDFTLEFDMAIQGGNNQASTFSVTGQSGSILKLVQTAANGTVWKVNDDEGITLNLTKGAWYTFKLTRVEGDPDMTYLTVVPKSGGDALMSQTLIASVDSGVKGMSFETKRYYSSLKIDNVVVRDVVEADVPQVTYYTVTTNCVDENNNILKTSTAQVQENDTYAPSYDVTFDDDNYRYTYSSGAQEQTITDDTTINLVYSKRALEDWTVTAVAGGVGTTIATETVKEGKSVKVAYPQYLLKDGTLYEAAKHDSTAREYNWTFTPDANNYVLTIPYTATTITDVVYLTEGEDIAGATKASLSGNSANVGIRSSNSQAAYASEDLVITSLPAGYYKLVGVAYDGSTGQEEPLKFKLGDNSYSYSVKGIVNDKETYKSNAERFESDSMLITDDADLVFETSGGGTVLLDYVYVVKTGEYEAPATPSVSAESAVKEGYITFKGVIANAATVDKAGFGFINAQELGNDLKALWTTNAVQNNTFGAAIEQQKGATHSAFYAVPYIVVNGNAVFGNVVASDWND